jgi:sporulation protein YlmC with PRC-barrel domain
MTPRYPQARVAGLIAAAFLFGVPPAWSQVAGGSTTVGVSIVESTQLAMGWSVKETLLGKLIYNEQGDKVGKVEDLIISPDRSLSYVIVGAGGFVGIGQHDVAVPVTQIEERAGKLVMPGATKVQLKAMPAFVYASDTTRRDQFVRTAEADIAHGKARVSDLEKKAGAAATDTKAALDLQITTLRLDVKSAEGKLGELKQAGVNRWKDFEAGVSAATARLRKSIESAAG